MLSGGRLLGPMERLIIVGLALAGHVTAAAVVVAAKGLRGPLDLYSRGDSAGPEVRKIVEYFLVGSFLSWSFALGSLVLLAQ